MGHVHVWQRITRQPDTDTARRTVSDEAMMANPHSRPTGTPQDTGPIRYQDAGANFPVHSQRNRRHSTCPPPARQARLRLARPVRRTAMIRQESLCYRSCRSKRRHTTCACCRARLCALAVKRPHLRAPARSKSTMSATHTPQALWAVPGLSRGPPFSFSAGPRADR